MGKRGRRGEHVHAGCVHGQEVVTHEAARDDDDAEVVEHHLMREAIEWVIRRDEGGD